VEDNPDDAELTEMALAQAGLVNRIVVVRDGQEALDYLFDESRGLPELVVLDLRLPRVSGLEVLRRLRGNERTRLARVVVLTTSNEQQDIRGAFDTGANAYVRKPVDFTEFAEAVRQLGLFWMVVSQPPPGPA
jgi:CheY-like chemotaxis protein